MGAEEAQEENVDEEDCPCCEDDAEMDQEGEEEQPAENGHVEQETPAGDDGGEEEPAQPTYGAWAP